MKTAFLFSGQGAQYKGMGKELYDAFPEVRKIYDQVQLDFDLKTLCFEGPEEQLQDTAYAQSCIYVTSLAIAELLNMHHIYADGCAGLSLGEYSAYAYAKSFSIAQGAKLVRERGKLMAHSLPAGTSAMAAILMLSSEQIERACDEVRPIGICEIANYNCPGQIVITGEAAAVEKAGELCISYGARRVIPLKVSGAFHSSLLKKAGIQLGNIIDTCDIRPSNIPVYNNITGNVVKDMSIKDILVKQISHSVYFQQTIEQMLEDGYTTFIEIGPGTAITGFVKKICKGQDVQILHVENLETLQTVINEVEV